jgi:hypothetical protein
MGVTIADFQHLGKMPEDRLKLKICVNGLSRMSRIFLINKGLHLSMPAELFGLRSDISQHTSSSLVLSWVYKKLVKSISWVYKKGFERGFFCFK